MKTVSPRGRRFATQAPTLEEAEWNFVDPKRLPDEEVAACFRYEYAREFAKGSQAWRRLVAEYERQVRLPKKNRERRNRIPLSREILALFGRSPVGWLCLSSELVKTPWQGLDRSARQTAVSDTEGKAASSASFQEFICLNITLERDLREYQPCGVESYQDWVRVDRCFHGRGEQREYGFIAINWDYTDDQLKDEFAKWLKEKRGERKAVQSDRGQNKRRQYLKALGAKRLLDAGFTAQKAMDYTERFLKDQQNAPKPLYENPRSWSDAKNRIVPSVLRELFPAPAAPPR